MKKILSFLISIIDKKNEDKKELLLKLSELEHDKKEFELSSQNINDTDLNLIEKYLTSEYINSAKYKLLKELKAYFSIYENESQVIESINFLKELVDSYKDNISNRILSIETGIKEIDEILRKFNRLKDILDNYNEEIFLEKEDFELLNEIIKHIEVDEEIVNFYIQIGKNNISHSKEKIEKFDSEDIFEQIESETPLQELIDEDDSKEKLKKDFESFNIEDYKEFLTDSYDEVERIINKFKESFDSFNLQDVIEASLAVEEGLDFFEALHNDELLIASLISIMDCCRKSDLDTINEIIEIFNNQYIEYYNFEEIDNENGITSTLQHIETIFGEQIRKISEFILSYESATEEEIKSGLNDYFEGKVKYKDYLIIKNYIKIRKLIDDIKDNRVNSDRLTEIEELLFEISKHLIKTEMVPGGANTPNEVNPYQDSFCNYIVFYDKDEYIREFEEMKDKYHDVSYVDLLIKLNTAIEHDLNSIQTHYSKPLNKKKGVSGNEYNIRELRFGNIRVHYKIVETTPIDGHPIILICGFNYGNVDGNQKNLEIQKTIKRFGDTISEYEKLKELFNGKLIYENLSEEAKRILGDGLELYKEVYNKTYMKDDELVDTEEVLSSEGGGRK